MQRPRIPVILEQGRYGHGTRRHSSQWSGRCRRYGYAHTPSLLCPILRHVGFEARKSYPTPTLVLFNARSINNKMAVAEQDVALACVTET